MKKIYLLVVLFTIIVGVTKAQEGINYQAVVRDNTGELMKNEAVAVEFSIIKTSTVGVKVYTETHALTTNNFGNIVAIIGQGTPTLGTFAAVNWSSSKHFLNVKINGVEMGTTEFLSVPYALHAKTADALTNPDWKKSGNNLFNSQNSVVIGSNVSDANKLTVTQTNTSGELVDFSVDTLSGNSDILNLSCNENTGGLAGQFIEMSKGGSTIFRINTDGTFTKPSQTGNANMLPIAYGTVSTGGVLNAGTSNIGVITNTATGIYDIVINDETINIANYVLIANSVASSATNASPTAVGGNLRIFTKSITSGNFSNAPFSFIIYKP